MPRFSLKYFLWFTALVFSVSSCSSQGPEHFQEKSRNKTMELIRELQKVECLEDIIQKSVCFKGLYLELVDLSIEVQKYQKKHETYWELEAEDFTLSDELRFEFVRIYKILGAKELMEKCQMSALLRLDAFESKCSRLSCADQ